MPIYLSCFKKETTGFFVQMRKVQVANVLLLILKWEYISNPHYVLSFFYDSDIFI